MQEITDETLSELRESLSLCNPLVQSLVRRLDRVEGEKGSLVQRNLALKNLFDHTHIGGNTALRERMKRMEEALQRIADYSTYDAQDLRDMAGDALKEGGEC